MRHSIRIYLEFEGGIENFVQRISVWHHKVCRVMTNGDPEVQIFLSSPHTNDGLFIPRTKGGGHIVFGADPVDVRVYPETGALSSEPVDGF